MVGKWIGIGAIGVGGAVILTLMLRPVALFVPEERWVQVDGIDFARKDAVSYSVNDGLRTIAGHWAYPAMLVVTLPPGTNEAAVRGRFTTSKESLPAVLRMNGSDRELLMYTSNSTAAVQQARTAGLRFALIQDPSWRAYRQYALGP